MQCHKNTRADFHRCCKLPTDENFGILNFVKLAVFILLISIIHINQIEQTSEQCLGLKTLYMMRLQTFLKPEKFCKSSHKSWQAMPTKMSFFIVILRCWWFFSEVFLVINHWHSSSVTFLHRPSICAAYLRTDSLNHYSDFHRKLLSFVWKPKHVYKFTDFKSWKVWVSPRNSCLNYTNTHTFYPDT